MLVGYGSLGGPEVARRTGTPKHPAGGTAGTAADSNEISAVEKAADDLLLLRTRVPGKLGAVISPLVRRMAHDHGVDLGGLHGSGANGLIMRKDVEAVIQPGPVATPLTKSPVKSLPSAAKSPGPNYNR